MGTERQLRARWETDRRYYAVRVYRDLFGELVLTRAWGGKFNRLGSMQTCPVADLEAARRELLAIDRQRRRHRYVRV